MPYKTLVLNRHYEYTYKTIEKLRDYAFNISQHSCIYADTRRTNNVVRFIEKFGLRIL